MSRIPPSKQIEWDSGGNISHISGSTNNTNKQSETSTMKSSVVGRRWVGSTRDERVPPGLFERLVLFIRKIDINNSIIIGYRSLKLTLNLNAKVLLRVVRDMSSFELY